MSTPQNSLITSEKQLRQVITDALENDAVALDTEFVWERTYYPKPSLIQVGWSQTECYLIDLVALEDVSPLAELLQDRNLCKILHDAPQDLMLLKRWTGADTVNVFDTRLAHGFAGGSSVCSLADLLAETLNVTLPKTETRTNWRKRPLSEAQISYAIDDIKYLAKLRQHLLELVEKAGNIEFLAEDLAGYDNLAEELDIDPHDRFRKLKGAGNLSPQKLSILQEVTAWREKEAMRADRPRKWIVPDRDLLAMARFAPQNLQELGKRTQLPEKTIKRCGKAILSAIQKGEDRAPELWPDLSRKVVDPELKERVDCLMKAVEKKAAERGIDPALVGPRAQFNELLSSTAENKDADNPLRSGWRAAFLEDLKV
ncbi:MAG: ribonuclease D [Planctomycetota bacterium]|jgi:ribonuclease D